MAKWNEVSYMVLDSLKLKSDDSSININHIVFLLLQYRAVLLEQRYTDQKKSIPRSNFQTICVYLEEDLDCTTSNGVISIDEIPAFTNLKGSESIKISPINKAFASLEYVFTNSERFPYVGNNKWLRNIIYFSLGMDNKLYLKSQNANFRYLKKVKVSAMFENPMDALELACDDEGNRCNFMDTEFPLESALISTLIELVLNNLNSSIYRPEDDSNNASDDLGDANYGYKDDRRRRRVQEDN